MVTEDRVADAAVTRVCRSVARKLDGAGWMGGADLRRLLAARDRPHFDEAVELLLASGQVVFEVAENKGPAGRRYRAMAATR
ncbi:hypothetical protein AB1484_27265 [Parafrankia sp. FMc6]|uniref:hypothetical protein n=1 Tax=Parafrankia soli TaxID=2599596 RepID=UPI0034D77849